MHNSISIGKRAFAGAVAAATILWAVGLAAFVAPLSASAAVAGDLVKGTTLSTVYYYAGDGKRYAFPNEKSYLTWYSDFSGVTTMSDSALAAIELGGNIVYRPGSRWIKIQSDPKVYAVTSNGSIRWIESQAVASGLGGSNWNTLIDDVADVFFVDYTVGPSLTSAAAAYEGALVESAGSTYLVSSGAKRLVGSSAFTANRYQNRFVLAGTGIDLSAMSAGTALAGSEAALTDTAQKGGVASVASSTGGLNISVATDTPAAATLPANARGVELAKFKLTASSGSTTIDQIVTSLGGIGATTNLAAVYLYQGSIRLSNARTVNSTTRMATFSGLGIKLDAGQTTNLSIKGDVAASPAAGATASFSLASASAVSSTGTVTGTFPAAGNLMSFSTTTVGTVEIDKEGSITNPTIGQKDAVIGRFRMAASTEDASIKELTLHVNDAKDHKNYKLFDGSTLLATGSNATGDLVNFVLTNPLKIEEGDTKHLKLSADIGGQTNDAIQVAFEETADVTAVGSDFGFNMLIDIGATSGTYDSEGSVCTSATLNCSYSTIQGGELTIAFNGPQAGNIQVDGKDVTLLKFTITSQNWTEIKDFDIIIDARTGSGAEDTGDNDNGGLVRGATTEANLKDFNLRIASTGKVWMGPLELDTITDATDASQTLDFTDDQTFNVGDSIDFILTTDVDNDAPGTEEFRATIDVSGISAEDANGDALTVGTHIVPGSDLVGNIFTTVASSLAVAGTTPPTGATYVKGAQNVPVVGFAFTAGTGSSIKVTDLTVTTDGDADGDYDATSTTDIAVNNTVNACNLYDNETGALVDGPESVTSSETILFENFAWIVPAGETDKLVVKCNFANLAPVHATADDYAFYISAAGSVTAEDADGDSVSATLSNGNSDGAVAEIAIANSGTLTIAVDGGTPQSTIILGNSTNVEVSRFKFTAATEGFTVDEVTLYNCDVMQTTPDDATACTTAGTDNTIDAVKLEYKDAAGVTKTQTGSLTSGFVVFRGMTMHVPTTNSTTLKVLVNTAGVSSTGATSGEQFGLHLMGDDATSVEFTAYGVGSSGQITEADADATALVVCGTTVDGCAGQRMTVRKSKPTISLASGSPSGAGIPGLAEVLRYNVAADSKGNIAIDEFTFKLTSTDTGTTTWNDCDDSATTLGDDARWVLYDMADPGDELASEDTDWIFYDAAGGNCGTGQDIVWAHIDLEETTDDSVEIAAGTTTTFSLWVSTANANTSNDNSVRFDIDTEANTDAIHGAATTVNAVEWDDFEDADDIIDGTDVKNLPVVGGTILY